MNNHKLRLKIAQARFDGALATLEIGLADFKVYSSNREPDQDDWDDTLHATAQQLEFAAYHARRAKQELEEGS